MTAAEYEPILLSAARECWRASKSYSEWMSSHPKAWGHQSPHFGEWDEARAYLGQMALWYGKACEEEER